MHYFLGMRQLFYIIIFLTSFVSFAQNEQLALDYFDKGEYEKAVTLFEDLYETQPSMLHFNKLLECYQELENYDGAFALIKKEDSRTRTTSPKLIIEEGYLYQLTNQQEKADKKYEEALQKIHENANYAYTVGSAFQEKSLLNWAVKAYEEGQKENPELNFDYQLALLSGQMGDLNGMINKLLDYAYEVPGKESLVKNYLTSFLMNDADNIFLNDLKKALILRVQKTPDIFWNQFLSWFYTQQKDYGKAFVQEKAVYKRNPESLSDIITLGYLAIADEQFENAQSIYEFVLENTTDKNTQYSADYYLTKIKIETGNKEEYGTIKSHLNSLLEKYEVSSLTLDLYLLAAHFECFNLNNPNEGINLLNKVLENRLNLRDQSKVKLELADILLYNEKFNQSILNYAQVESNMKNDEMAHEASMKMAKANYYKNDFDWSLKQVKVLKQSASFLIANDALELFLLINDNTAEDSLQMALKAFSRADLKLYQNKKEEALQDFLNILSQYKDDAIEDEAMLKVAGIYTQLKDYEKAASYYQKILDQFPDSVYRDDALFYAAELYRNFLEDDEKAKSLYEKIIFDHQDSIFFTESRRLYRTLRGDITS